MNTRPEPIYSTAQRFTALGYGLASHTLFLASVAAITAPAHNIWRCGLGGKTYP